jgi:CubicO group peptidase (beta-lactamase class C family)
MRRKLSFLLLFLLAAPAASQQVPRAATPYDRAIAAGYKALTLCSAMFNGDGRTQAQVEALELTGIYPEYDAIVPTLRAEVQRNPAGVRVAFDPGMPPRFAGWQRERGCRLAPIGYFPAAPSHLPPRPDLGPALTDMVDRRPWPLGEETETPTTPAAVAATVGRAFDGSSYGTGRTTGVVVVHDGRIVAERYADGFGVHVAQRTWSVAKSIAGTLVGIAVAEGALHPESPPPIPEWVGDPRSAIRLDQLLRMGSGLTNSQAGNRTDATYFGGVSVTQEIASWPLATAPGTRFRYANNDILAAVRGLRHAINDDTRYRAYPRERLFAPLGMTRTVAEMDWQGNFILSSQVWSTARDLARLGQFWLQDGIWKGRRLLPEGWMAYMTRASGPQPPTGPGYGATLWLFGPGQGLPAGSYAAQGNRGQYVMVVPSRRLVIVRRGEDGNSMRFDIARFTADVIAALPERERR